MRSSPHLPAFVARRSPRKALPSWGRAARGCQVAASRPRRRSRACSLAHDLSLKSRPIGLQMACRWPISRLETGSFSRRFESNCNSLSMNSALETSNSFSLEILDRFFAKMPLKHRETARFTTERAAQGAPRLQKCCKTLDVP